MAQVHRAGRPDLLLAVSERLTPARVVWFTDRLLPTAVLDVLEGAQGRLSDPPRRAGRLDGAGAPGASDGGYHIGPAAGHGSRGGTHV